MKKLIFSSLILLSLISFTPVFAVEDEAPAELVSVFQKILLSFKQYLASLNRTTQTGAGFLSTNGLTAHYTFDDTPNDGSGNGHNAVLSGSPTYVAGKIGKALNLNGSNQYATRDAKVVTSFPFTFSAWVKGSGIIVSTEDKDANTPYYNVGVTGTTASLIARDSIGNEDGIYSGGVKVGEWNHVVAVFQSADNRRLYVNGVEKVTSSVNKTFNTAVDRLSIGRTGRSAHGGYFNGQIDDVRIYSIALVQEEVTALYSGDQPTTSTGDTGGNTSTNTTGGNQNTQTGSAPTNTPTDPVLHVKADGTGNYRSISECAGAAKAGNTCLVYPGTYKENISLASSGTAGNPIILKAAFPYNKNSTENRTVVNGVITTKNHTVVEGLEVSGGTIVVNGSNVQVLGNYIHGSDTYAPYDGISVNRVKPYHSNITIKNNRLYQLSHGMGIFCSDNCLIENNEIERLFTIERCRLSSAGCGADVDAVRIFGNGITFKNNKIFGNKLSEMWESAHVDGIQSFTNGGLGGQGYDTLTNTIIEGNYIADVHQAIWMTTASSHFNGIAMSNNNITFRNNILNNGAGFGSARSAIGGDYADNIYVYNNTFLQATRFTATKKLIIKNNIFVNNAVLDDEKFYLPLKQYEFTNNILTDEGWLNKTTIKLPAVAGTNKFIVLRSDIMSSNYNLKAGSPAIDYGTPLASTGFSNDINGTARPQGGAWDVGAYEWYSGQPVTNPPQPQAPTTPTQTPTTYTLTTTVIKSGSGSGTITGTGISCGTDCAEAYNSGTSVTLTATPVQGSTFTGWSGACSGTTTTCNVTMSGIKTVSATFNSSSFGNTNLSINTDSDSDGVADSLDRCSSTATSLKSLVNAYGCPKPLLTTFDIKPDLTNLDLNSIPVLELGKTNIGKVRWSQAVPLTRTTAQLDLDTHLKIERNKVTLNSVSVPELNKPAVITLYGITQTNPTIKKDGVICTAPTCIINSFSNGTLVFTVTGFSTYEVVEGVTPPVITPPATPTPTPTTGDPTPQPVASSGGGGGGGGGSKSNTSSSLTLPTNATREQLISYLIAKIQELLTEYNRIKALEGGTTSTDTVLKGFQFTKTFGIGTNSSEVRYLQRFLNTHGFPVGTGLGSYGKEVDTFGPVTKATLIKYQLANGIEGTGYFGQLTKAKVNQVLLGE